MRANKQARLIAIATTAAAGALVLSFGVGTALAFVPALLAPSGLAAADGSVTKAMGDPTYSTNSDGLTYGSVLDADSPENEPDLIAIEATNGQSGYLLKGELDAASGGDVSTPEQAVEWSKNGGRVDHIINVYAQDGKTVVGEFVITGSDSAGASAKN